jgi:hypothetical protein
MLSQINLAIPALQGMTAVTADLEGVIAAPVEEEHDLLLPVQGFPDGGGEATGKDGKGFLAVESLFHFHIHDLHGGQGSVGNPAGHGQAGEFPDAGIETGLYRRRRRSEDNRRPVETSFDDGQIPGVVRQPVILLIGGVVFLIDNDQLEIPDRGKEGGTHPHGHMHFPAPQALPLVITDGPGDAAMEDGDVFIPESFFETREELRSQGNFRNEIDNPPPASADLLHGL